MVTNILISFEDDQALNLIAFVGTLSNLINNAHLSEANGPLRVSSGTTAKD
jgi:hypothetical protein